MYDINTENRFNIAPTVTAPRSRFLMHQNIRTTFNAGLLIPFFVDTDIMPGDTFKVRGTFLVRQSTPIYPTMDNSFLDVFFFFIPHRLVWDHWKEFWGENTTGNWTQTVSYQVPQIILGKTDSWGTVAKGDILDYMGIPQLSLGTNNSKTISIAAFAPRAYQLTWNDWFRDENFAAPQYVYKGDADSSLVAGNDATYGWGNYDDNASTGYYRIPATPAPVYKYKDMYNSLLLEPQKGNPIKIALGTTAPVIGNGNIIGLTDGTGNNGIAAYSSEGIHFGRSLNLNATNPIAVGTAAGAAGSIAPDNIPLGTGLGLSTDATKSGLIADLSNAVAATINAQRMAFAAQRILEAKARTGTRYVEICNAFFGVQDTLSARMQRPEFLGARHIPITMNQVAQTSSTDTTSPQGNVAAFSLTVDSEHIFSKSFVEHGTLLACLAVRQEHSYDGGIDRMWSRKDILDFYTPQMAYLGEQEHKQKEIYCDGTANDETTLGFNERFVELRTKINKNTGAFSTRYAQSLDSWHYGDAYSTQVVLSDAWRRETKDFIDRTLAVQSSVEDQYLMDCRLDFDCVRCCPMYAIPGLMDHF